jgi:hypothetical protein
MVVTVWSANQQGKLKSIVRLREREHCGRGIAQNGHAALIGDPSQQRRHAVIYGYIFDVTHRTREQGLGDIVWAVKVNIEASMNVDS